MCTKLGRMISCTDLLQKWMCGMLANMLTLVKQWRKARPQELITFSLTISSIPFSANAIIKIFLYPLTYFHAKGVLQFFDMLWRNIISVQLQHLYTLHEILLF